MDYGFIKVASAVPSVRVADCKYNVEQIEEQIVMAEGQGAEIIVFPELSITGYTCQDLFRQNLLLETSEAAMLMLLDFTRQLNIISIVGLPIAVGDLLLNCAAVIQKGQILGVVAKEYLPNYSEFYEKRWFASSQDLRTTDFRYAGSLVHISQTPQAYHHPCPPLLTAAHYHHRCSPPPTLWVDEQLAEMIIFAAQYFCR